MSKYLKSIFIIVLSLLVTTCDNDSDDGGSGSGGSSGTPPESNFDPSGNLTGEPNEVVLTVKVNSRSFDVDVFIAAVAGDLGCDTSQIEVNSSVVVGDVAYVVFVFVAGSINTDSLIAGIQYQMNDGSIGGYDAMIIIANMDDDLCEMDEDCAEICGGDATEDPCGVCGGDGSSCDTGDLIGLYQMYSVELYDDVNDDGTCSGNLIDQHHGPNFETDDSYSYGNIDECDGGVETYAGSFNRFAYLNSNGQYLSFSIEEESEDNYEYCYDDSGDCGYQECMFYYCGGYEECDYVWDDYGGWYDCWWVNEECEDCWWVDEECEDTCDNGECSYCYSSEDLETEIWLETGEWNADSQYIYINDALEMGWEYGAYISESTECGDVTNPYTELNNGCIEIENDYDDDIYEPVTYVKTGNILYVHDGKFSNDYDWGDDYYYDYSNIECEKIEFRELTSWPSIGGCTDPFAVNYNPVATYDDDTCDEGECFGGGPHPRLTEVHRHRNHYINND